MNISTFPGSGGLRGTEYMWFFEILIGMVVLMVVNYAFKRIVQRVRRLSLSTTDDWKGKIDQIFFLPFQILLWVLGITLGLEVLGRRFGLSFFENYIDPFRSSGFIFCVGWALLKWKAVLQSDLLNKDHTFRTVDTSFMQAVGKIASVVIVVIGLMIILQVWGLDIAPLIAFGSIGAAAIGFASKDIIANFCGGLMLHINRPFVQGDVILIPSQNLEGYVEEIGWSLSRVRDKQKRPVYLPNSIFSNVTVINASRMTHRRIEEKIGIRHQDFFKMPVIVENLKEVISAHPSIDTHLPVLVVFESFNPMSLNLYIDFYTLETRYEKYLIIKHEVLMFVYEELMKVGAKMPVPMMSISSDRSSLQEFVTH